MTALTYENFNTAIEKGQPADHEIISQTVFIKHHPIKNHPFKITTIALLAAMSLSACQSTPTNLPVLQRANNTLETTGLGKSKNIAKLNALHIATEQCRGKSPIVLTDSYQYNGVLDENMGRAADQAIGMIGSVFGSKKTLARDDDYEYTMTFRCP